MTGIPSVLLAVANELAASAKSSLPELNDGEEVQREWLEDGVFYRETMLNGDVFRYLYDFRQRKSRRMAVTK